MCLHCFEWVVQQGWKQADNKTKKAILEDYCENLVLQILNAKYYVHNIAIKSYKNVYRANFVVSNKKAK